MSQKKSLIKNDESAMSFSKKCELLSCNRGTVKYQKKHESPENINYLGIIENIHLDYPTWGSRKITAYLKNLGYNINRKRVQRLMRVLCIEAIYPGPNFSKRGQAEYVRPYLLNKLEIDRPNQVWSIDITYIRMGKDFCYMFGIIDWYSRKLLDFQLSNTLLTSFCIDTLRRAITKYGKPEIINSDQGSQFTSKDFDNFIKADQLQLSMDGKGRWADNIAIERFWGTMKRDEVYLNEYEDIWDAEQSIMKYIDIYNGIRPHAAIGNTTPDILYNSLTIGSPYVA